MTSTRQTLAILLLPLLQHMPRTPNLTSLPFLFIKRNLKMTTTSSPSFLRHTLFRSLRHHHHPNPTNYSQIATTRQSANKCLRTGTSTNEQIPQLPQQPRASSIRRKRRSCTGRSRRTLYLRLWENLRDDDVANPLDGCVAGIVQAGQCINPHLTMSSAQRQAIYQFRRLPSPPSSSVEPYFDVNAVFHRLQPPTPRTSPVSQSNHQDQQQQMVLQETKKIA